MRDRITVYYIREKENEINDSVGFAWFSFLLQKND